MNKHGQNVIEYIALTAAVVGVFVLLLAPGGRFHRAVENNVNAVVPLIDQGSGAIQFTGPASGGGGNPGGPGDPEGPGGPGNAGNPKEPDVPQI